MNNKETPEEAAKEFANNSAVTNYEQGLNVGKYQGFICGAKWQQEQDKNKFSDKEMVDFARWLILTNEQTQIFKGITSLEILLKVFNKERCYVDKDN
jgi:hypothetical protein